MRMKCSFSGGIADTEEVEERTRGDHRHRRKPTWIHRAACVPPDDKGIGKGRAKRGAWAAGWGQAGCGILREGLFFQARSAGPRIQNGKEKVSGTIFWMAAQPAHATGGLRRPQRAADPGKAWCLTPHQWRIMAKSHA